MSLFSFSALRFVAPALFVTLTACADSPEAKSDVDDFTAVTNLFATPKGKAARYPIVLAHGFNASPTSYWGFNGVAEALRKDGHKVYVATVPPYNSAAVRASYLKKFVDTAIADGAPRVNIIAHSMGGLDARYLITSLGYGKKVASLTTVSTPHQGTAVADASLGFIDGLGPADDAVDAIATMIGRSFSDVAEDTNIQAAFFDLSEENAPAFNQANPDDPAVYYQSWAGVSGVGGFHGPHDDDACEGLLLGANRKADKMDPLLLAVAGFVAHGFELRSNDGVVTVESAKWGKFQGCVPADHLDEVGQVHDSAIDARTGFDHLRFYRTMMFKLAAQGY